MTGDSFVLAAVIAPLRRVAAALPEGRGLGPEAWMRRHRVILGVLWLHVLGLPLFGLSRGYSFGHCLTDAAPVALLALAALQPRGGQVLRSVLAALGLMTSSAVLVHLSGGVMEAHFHFFVMIALLSAYRDWVPFLFALAFVVVEHGVIGVIDPRSVHDEIDEVLHPWRWALIHGGFVLAAAAANVYAWTTSEEDHRRAVAESRRSEETFRALFECSPQPMWVYEVRTLAFLAVNEAAITHYGYSRDEFLAMSILDIRPAEDAGRVRERVRLGDSGASGVWEHRVRDGRSIHVEISSEHLAFHGRDAKLIVAHDITERLALEGELHHRAFHDALSGLANRDLFHDRLGHALARLSRQGQPLAVLTLDLDDFKAINDSRGHHTGDQVLREVARRLEDAVRPGDTVARMGGDEFALLLEEVDVVAAEAIAARITAAMQRPILLHDEEMFVTTSGGLSVCSGWGCSEHELLRHADIALYAAKAAGKGVIETFTPAMRESGDLHRIEVAARLRQALVRGELFLEYQPVIRLSTGGVRGVEALVRWRDPERGVVSPAEFIPVAEDTGLIVPLGEWVLAEACRQVRVWEAGGAVGGGERLALSVNISPRQLREPDFVAVVARVLDATGFDPAQLVLELTESAVLDGFARCVESLEQLRALGIRIAIDDFGSGYSSLGYLRDLPLDTVKIDRRFIAGIGEDAAGRELTLAIVRLVDTLGLPTIAEGMETAGELDYVRALGIDFAQGYFLSRPLSAPAMAQFLAGSRVAELMEYAAAS
ncbi:MAG TPA: EAL domain-containing protein [Candidatus Dormibacteraeota bacterium]|nr:EAL domain-containing protein [Candidatus Dormibacteraeota bacterium]